MEENNMCLYPRLIKNRKYTENKKNRGIIPPVYDERTLYVPVGCQQCIECRKAKTREWRVRLAEDIKTNKNGKFITLTFSNESIKELTNMPATKDWPGMEGLTGYELDNEIAIRAVRLFLERWRKRFKKSLRHWLVTELGHEGTENIHLHGIVWTDESFETIREIWGYGYMWPRPSETKKNYVSGRTINYMVKYVHKVDEKHRYYRSRILTSPGIGSNYLKTPDAQKNKFNYAQTNETYRTSNGYKMGLPIYWRNKLYTDQQKEALWINKLDKEERYVCGEKIDVSKNHNDYFATLQHYRRKNAELGYGNGDKSWVRAEYEKQRRELMHGKRIAMAKG